LSDPVAAGRPGGEVAGGGDRTEHQAADPERRVAVVLVHPAAEDRRA
jgi:hypothetical protein